MLLLVLVQLHMGGKAHFPHKGGDANVDVWGFDLNDSFRYVSRTYTKKI